MPVRPPCHVWVDVTGSWSRYRAAGLLLEWRRVVDAPGKPARWEALVLWACSDAHGWRSQVGWLRAEHVRPAPATLGEAAPDDAGVRRGG